ncbi:hypothetical protein GCM10010156_75970 [Planobispora rosea]|nr:hypothetical protein [Planobispora rosea]GGT07542.1 hypothetical protein GCM10010156_75970 [Planobispora rosea]GIH89221.1 hypothetical protein Pro02_76290 [Planobispora rosea]
MRTPAEMDRKVSQLDNDVQEIYTMLSDIQATQRRQANRLTTIEGKLDEQNTKLDDILSILRDK